MEATHFFFTILRILFTILIVLIGLQNADAIMAIESSVRFSIGKSCSVQSQSLRRSYTIERMSQIPNWRSHNNFQPRARRLTWRHTKAYQTNVKYRVKIRSGDLIHEVCTHGRNLRHENSKKGKKNGRKGAMNEKLELTALTYTQVIS